MKHYTLVERSTAVIGFVFIIFGIVMTIYPTEMTVVHDSTNGNAEIPLGPDVPEHVSKEGSQFYGVLSVVMGTGISSLALYRGRKQ